MTVNGKRVSKADVTAEDDNDISVVHVVTEVLYPLVKKNYTIPQVLLNDDKFSTLVSVLRDTGLLNALESGIKLRIILLLDINDFLFHSRYPKSVSIKFIFFRGAIYALCPNK